MIVKGDAEKIFNYIHSMHGGGAVPDHMSGGRQHARVVTATATKQQPDTLYRQARRE